MGFNVMDYGAKADQETDDTAAIQAALDAAAGEVISFPPGVYRTSVCLDLRLPIEYRPPTVDYPGSIRVLRSTSLVPPYSDVLVAGWLIEGDKAVCAGVVRVEPWRAERVADWRRFRWFKDAWAALRGRCEDDPWTYLCADNSVKRGPEFSSQERCS